MTLILNPTALTALLPIIIPSGLLTIGIPTYAIIKNTKNSLEKNPTKKITTINQQSEPNTTKKEIADKKINNYKTQDNQIYRFRYTKSAY